jgi:hypothetical protein
MPCEKCIKTKWELTFSNSLVVLLSNRRTRCPFALTRLKCFADTQTHFYPNSKENKKKSVCFNVFVSLRYVPSAVRLGQARPYAVGEALSVNEWEILLETGERQSFKGEQVVIEAHTPQTSLYRIVTGSFSVYVGDTRVGQLIALDWVSSCSNHNVIN